MSLRSILVFLVLTFSHSTFAKTVSGPAATGVMQALFSRISFLLPLSFQNEKFADPKNTLVRKQIDGLDDSAAGLEALATQNGDDFHFLAKNLHQDIRQVKIHYDQGKFRQSAFVLQNLTETCFACHTKYKEEHKVPTPASFYAQIGFDSLSLREKAKIYVVTRQFAQAQKKYEQILLSQTKDSVAGIEPAIEQYLAICLGVLSDLKSPQKSFEKMLATPNLTSDSRNLIGAWISDLKELQKLQRGEELSLAQVQKLIAKAQKRTNELYDKNGLVYWTMVRSQLNELTLNNKAEPKDEAEIYYWLGVTATMFEHSYWVAQMPFYLEKAITLADDHQLARQAFDLLEKNILLGYTGSGGTHLPAEEKSQLSRLRVLVDSKIKRAKAASQPKKTENKG